MGLHQTSNRTKNEGTKERKVYDEIENESNEKCIKTLRFIFLYCWR